MCTCDERGYCPECAAKKLGDDQPGKLPLLARKLTLELIGENGSYKERIAERYLRDVSRAAADLAINETRKYLAEQITTEANSQLDSQDTATDDFQRTYTRGRVAGLTWALQLLGARVEVR